MRLPSWPSGRSWWPRGTLAQFGVMLVAAVVGSLLLFVWYGFRNDWEFPVDPYRARYFYDDSSVHTTDWSVARVGDIDSDGHADLVVRLPFDPVSEACRMSAWVVSGKTGEGTLRIAIPGTQGDGPYSVGSVGGCYGFSIESLAETSEDFGSRLALSSLLDADSRGAVLLLAPSDRSVVRVLRGDAPSQNFGWCVGGVGDLDGDRADDVVIGSRFPAVAQAFSGATGTRLWSLEIPEREGPKPPEAEYMEPWFWVESICELDDLDGDGAPEVALGVPWADYAPGSVFLVSGRSGAILHRVDAQRARAPGMPGTALGRPMESIPDHDSDGRRDLLVGALTLPSRILSTRTLAWTDLRRPLYRARTAGDVDSDGAVDFIGSERHFWDPEEIVVASGREGVILHRFRPEPGFRFLSEWRQIGDMDADGRADLAVVSDNELSSGWGSYNWDPGFGAVTVYSGEDGSVLRRVDRETLLAAARAGIQEWTVK